jgi:hypothetical protein
VKQRGALKDKEKLGTQINGKFNGMSKVKGKVVPVFNQLSTTS